MRYHPAITQPENRFNPFGISTPSRARLASHLRSLPKADRKELIRRLTWVGNFPVKGLSAEALHRKSQAFLRRYKHTDPFSIS